MSTNLLAIEWMSSFQHKLSDNWRHKQARKEIDNENKNDFSPQAFTSFEAPCSKTSIVPTAIRIAVGTCLVQCIDNLLLCLYVLAESESLV